MGITDYSFTTPDNNETNPYTMSGIDVLYNFGHMPISRASAGNFEAGLGVYHFSDDIIMGKYGLKLNLGYNFSTAINAEKGFGAFARGTGQLVYTDNADFTFVPRATLGLCYKTLQFGFFGEYQNTAKENITEGNFVSKSSNAYTYGVEFRFNIR
jgi:hypothetical protein